jgi:hypothetical protein
VLREYEALKTVVPDYKQLKLNVKKENSIKLWEREI